MSTDDYPFHKIINDHPRLFSKCTYIECLEGWKSLIEQLADRLEELIIRIDPDSKHDFYMTQMKEKYGALCCYMRSYTDEMLGLIEEAERESIRICEVCGEKGETLKINSWYATRCDKHKKD